MTPPQSPARDGDELWVVCHGPGRGRLPGMAQQLVAAATSDRPWRSRLRVHETGSPPPDLSRARAVVFWLADPLRELYPACFDEAMSIAARARAGGARIVNAPEALSHTIKSVQAKLWRDAGLPCAPAAPFATPSELERVLGECAYPAIVRPDRLHTQRGAHYCASAAEARAVPVTDGLFPGVVIPFVDTREGYRRAQPGTPWARFFHKKRALIFGDDVLPNHLFFSSHPICGLKRSRFARYLGHNRRWSWRARFDPTDRAVLALDNSFWRAPPEHADLLRRAARALSLDILAIDYSTTAEGDAMLWEANPYFEMPRPEDGVMPRERRLRERIGGFHRGIGRFLSSLLDEVA
jgi:hypothetical protein